MSGSLSTLHSLRQLLAERFPQAARIRAGELPTGVAPIDEALGGGLPVGLLTELVSAAPSSGGQLVLAQTLASARELRRRVALVDAADAFDPQALEPGQLRHLLWVRCRGAEEAIQAAELLIRDGNFGLVALDLRGTARSGRKRIPASAWFRLQRAAERGDAAVLVQTTEPLVPAVARRLILEKSLPLSACGQTRTELAGTLAVERARVPMITEELTG